jgi:hypothetical protein
MSLLDDLRQAAGSVDPQFQPTSNETTGVLAALVAYTEHGDEFLKAAADEDGTAAVTELLAPPADEGGKAAEPKQPAGSPAGGGKK